VEKKTRMEVPSGENRLHYHQSVRNYHSTFCVKMG